jgi:monoamine oxidase
VLAIPFAVYDGIDLSNAGFDALKWRAIRSLGRGVSSKLQLQFTDRYWERRGPWGASSTGSSNTDAGYQESWDVTRAQRGATGILNLFSGGSVAAAMNTRRAFASLEASASDAGLRFDAIRGLSQLERVFPGGAARWIGKSTQSLWHLSPYAKLSYSFYKPGQYTSFAGYESVRQGGILFAGEHTSVGAQGYMEGAAAEGARAASELLELI